MSARRYTSWSEVIADFVPRIRDAERGIGARVSTMREAPR